MGTSVVRIEATRWGVLHGGDIAVLEERYPSHRELMDDYVQHPERFEIDGLPSMQLDQAQLLAPVTRDIQIFCQGLNYGSHREETGSSERSAFNLLFLKAWSSPGRRPLG